VLTELLAAVAVATGCQSHACEQRVARRDFEQRDHVLRHRCNRSIPACIDRAAHLHQGSAGWMRSIAWCESRMNPGASNGTHFGLFQFDWQTWRGSPYDHRGSVWSPKWASLATAWYLRRGQSTRWACA
jgi:hypothetical protein